MNDVERDQWLTAIGDIESADDLLRHHATLENYLEQVSAQAKNVRRVLKQLETLAAEAAFSNGQTTAAFNHGDVMLKEKTVFEVNDWESFYAWIAEDPLNRMTGFLHKREGSTAIGKHQSDHGSLPPGTAERLITDIVIKSRLPESE